MKIYSWILLKTIHYTAPCSEADDDFLFFVDQLFFLKWLVSLLASPTRLFFLLSGSDYDVQTTLARKNVIMSPLALELHKDVRRLVRIV